MTAARLTEHAALIAGAKIQVDAGFIRLLIKCNMDKVIQLDELGRRNQNHTSCRRNNGRNGDFFHFENQNSHKECRGIFFPKYSKGCHIHTIHEPDKSQASGTRVGWR